MVETSTLLLRWVTDLLLSTGFCSFSSFPSLRRLKVAASGTAYCVRGVRM